MNHGTSIGGTKASEGVIIMRDTYLEFCKEEGLKPEKEKVDEMNKVIADLLRKES